MTQTTRRFVGAVAGKAPAPCITPARRDEHARAAAPATQHSVPEQQVMASPEHSGNRATAARQRQLKRTEAAAPLRACLPHCIVTAWRWRSLLEEARSIIVSSFHRQPACTACFAQLPSPEQIGREPWLCRPSDSQCEERRAGGMDA